MFLVSGKKRGRDHQKQEKAPSVAGGAFLVTRSAYRIRPGDNPPKLVVVVVTKAEQQILRIGKT
jgi:hypothetical protein